jgi:hypothetical protein
MHQLLAQVNIKERVAIAPKVTTLKKNDISMPQNLLSIWTSEWYGTQILYATM